MTKRQLIPFWNMLILPKVNKQNTDKQITKRQIITFCKHMTKRQIIPFWNILISPNIEVYSKVLL
jgi:hypothetical protein